MPTQSQLSWSLFSRPAAADEEEITRSRSMEGESNIKKLLSSNNKSYQQIDDEKSLYDWPEVCGWCCCCCTFSCEGCLAINIR